MTDARQALQKLRARFPGDYDDLDDNVLLGRLKAKYPDDYGDLELSAPAPVAAPSRASMVEMPPSQASAEPEGRFSAALRLGGEFATGAAQGLGSTGYSIADIMRRSGAAPDILRSLPPQKPEMLNPKTTAAKVGYGVEQVAEFLSPAGLVGKGAKAIEAASGALKLGPRMAKLLNVTGRAGLEGASAATVTAAQGGTEGDIKRNALVAGSLSAVIGPVLQGVGKVGQKIESSIIRPTIADVKSGYRTSNVFKYNLGGSLKQTAEKTEALLEDLSGQLKKATAGSATRIDLGRTLADVETELLSNKAKTVGMNSKIRGAIDHWTDELATVSPSGVVDVATAQELKRSIGKYGAWLYGHRDPEVNAIEAVANTLYTKMRLAIEKAAPDVKAINGKLEEVIPIQHALIRRMPVAERNNIMSLSDVAALIPTMGGATPANLWIFGLNRLLKSGRVANAAFKTGKAGEGIASRTSQVLPGMLPRDKETK